MVALPSDARPPSELSQQMSTPTPPPAEIEPPGGHERVDEETRQREGKRVLALAEDAAPRCSAPREQQHAHADREHRERALPIALRDHSDDDTPVEDDRVVR
jgi:hypothetical protein